MVRSPFPFSPSFWRLSFLLTGIFLISVASAQDYITLTKGGGVTGNTTSFRISRSGEVSKGSGIVDPEFSEFGQLRRSQAKKYFRKTHALMKKQTFNYPGNTYSAIALKEGETEYKLVWGDPGHETPRKAVKLYQKIQASLDRLTFREELRK